MYLIKKNQIKLISELRKLEESKFKSGNNIRRKNEIDDELKLIETNITTVKSKLRELNAFYL